MPTMPGPIELVVILVIVAMLFGVGKLPEVFGAVGKGIREFRNNSSDPAPTQNAPQATEVREESTHADAGVHIDAANGANNGVVDAGVHNGVVNNGADTSADAGVDETKTLSHSAQS